jgi:hypothetical protein
MRTLLVALSLTLVPLSSRPDIDPCEEQADLSPTNVDVGDQCGYSVAAEGSRMAMGAPFHDGKGAVFIYSFNGTSWTLDSTVIPNQLQSGDNFGWSVSMDSGLLAVGAKNDDTMGSNAGAVYVFHEVSSAQWAIDEKLLPEENAEGFGESVSLWDDTVAVGERLHKRAYVFRQSGSSWIQEGDADGPPFDNPTEVEISSFGESVALYQDTLLVGDDDYNPGEPNGDNLGIVHVYNRTGNTWTHAQEPIVNPSGDTDSEHFGETVALHGRWAVIGAPQEDPNDISNSGVVYLYKTDAAGVYDQDHESVLTASDPGIGDGFGLAVAIRGGVLVVGAPNKDILGGDDGAAYQFNLAGGAWTEVGTYVRDTNDLTTFDKFGQSVAIGSYAAVGAPGHLDVGTTGRAYLWSLCE